MAKTGYGMVLALAVIIAVVLFLLNVAVSGNNIGSSLFNSAIVGIAVAIIGSVGWALLDYVKPDKKQVVLPGISFDINPEDEF